MVSKYSGRCRCGNVTYTISGEPVWNMSCHCNWCQTTSGSAFRTFVLFKEKDLEISGDSFSSYEDTTTDHGRSMINQFCMNCGTQIGINVPNMDTRHISIGTLDQRRDIKIKEYFKQNNLEIKTFNSSLLFEPSKIQNLSKSYFKVFTPFWKKCLTQISQIQTPRKITESLHLVQINSRDGLDLKDLNLLPKNPDWSNNWDALYKVSEEEAHNLAEEFMNNRMLNYVGGRDFPATNNTSFLSPYLHFGLISAKQIYFKSMMFVGNAGLSHFLSEIGWREFSYHLLYHFKDLPTKNFKPKFDNFVWNSNQEDLEKWQKGMTGFPLIDAGMRQLWQTGWMHNRVRMVVASFLTKNLLIDWRIGQKWFWDCLVDADLAANSASWQWVAGSGADAAPYFRIFNPITQSQKFDPKGEYIRKWVPEIAHLSNKEIHLPVNRGEYPEAIIDLKFSRNRALAVYKNIS